MASSINASTSGPGGVITTADNSGILQLQSGGNTVATVGPSGLSTPTGSTINVPNTFGFKNRLINGNFEIAQRGTSFTLTSGTTAYTLDRWYVNTTGGAGTVAQTGSVGSYGLQVTGASGVSSGFFGQKIESYNIADLAGQTITYSITLSSSTLTSITWYARYPTAQDNYTGVTNISNGTITLTSTPTQYTFQIALPSGAANGLEIYFQFGSFTSGTLTIKNAQIELGSQATSFDVRSIGTELALCQRYAWKCNQSIGLVGVSKNDTCASPLVALPVTMRTIPSFESGASFTVASGSAGTPAISSGSVTGIASSPNAIWVYNSANNWTVSVNNYVQLTAVLSAEL